MALALDPAGAGAIGLGGGGKEPGLTEFVGAVLGDLGLSESSSGLDGRGALALLLSGIRDLLFEGSVAVSIPGRLPDLSEEMGDVVVMLLANRLLMTASGSEEERSTGGRIAMGGRPDSELE